MSDALIAFFGVVGAALLGFYWNFRNAKDLRKQPFLSKQLELCIEASNVAAKLATTTSKATFDAAHARFLELFWGPLSIVENDEVASAMVEFGKTLDRQVKAQARLPLKALENPSYVLAIKIRKLILEAWRIRTLEEVLEPRRF